MKFEEFVHSILNNVIRETLYRHWEYGCDTNITDEDMLKLQIDWALENGDVARFIELSNHLNQLEKGEAHGT